MGEGGERDGWRLIRLRRGKGTQIGVYMHVGNSYVEVPKNVSGHKI